MNPDFSSLEDSELLQLATGNRKAFEAIFDRYWKRLYSYAYKIYQEEAVCEDIVQEVFISLWDKNKASKILNLEAYLLKAVKYKVANHIRSLKFSTAQIEYLESIPDEPNHSLEYKEFEKAMMSHIELLPQKCKEVFKLSRIEQKSNKEIAQALNLSARTVETHISNALSFLRKHAGVFEIGVIASLICL
ncbi:RNA polymerase sigma-70 factor [Mesonia sp. K7]|uniref:RNA polymerase sigma-70 factor n=1 Tax=Mesonia sp. K7 TaxID=2218606 RepID=UPI000DA81628|nr:RNA polymerase sigma-70 factor [Mesonia sp. K7]PZD79217.1 RNA polymerase sigma-70 factor [Mesonia sp. K7]